MTTKSNSRLLSFWSSMMDRIDSNVDWTTSIPGMLKDLCEFFSFGCAFLYEADLNDVLILRERYAVYPNKHTQVRIDLGEALEAEYLAELAARKTVISQPDQPAGPLEERLAALFQASSMVLVPILSQERALIALIGMVDRRSRSRLEDIDIAYSISILQAIAGHVKLQLYQTRVEATQHALVDIMDNMGVELYVNDFYTHEILYMNHSMAQHYGGVENVLGKICYEVLFGYDRQCDFCPRQKLVDSEGEPLGPYSWDFFRSLDKSWQRVVNAAFRWVDGRLAHVVSGMDVTANKRNEKLVRHMTDYDALTGLPNRRKLLRDLAAKIPEMQALEREGYLLFFDLDSFKAVNDELGHRAGDELLCRIASFLDTAQLTRQRVYRHGSDEFVILCSNRIPGRVHQILSVLGDRFEHPWTLADGDALCRASVGVAHFPGDAVSPEELLHCADLSMYEAKRRGGGARFYCGGDYRTPEEYRSVSDKATPRQGI